MKRVGLGAAGSPTLRYAPLRSITNIELSTFVTVINYIDQIKIGINEENDTSYVKFKYNFLASHVYFVLGCNKFIFTNVFKFICYYFTHIILAL